MNVLPLLAAVLGLAAGANAAPLPDRLADTGWGGTGMLPFSPRFALWSDGAEKRRFVRLPSGRAIDASKVDAWDFPPGTRLWKEFSHGGRPVETRYIERLPDRSWRFASYVWNESGTEAHLAPAAGLAGLRVAAAPDGRYDVPSREDCRACHDSVPVPVLGLSAVQQRDTLAQWVAQGRLVRLPNLPPEPEAPPAEAAALGVLHANCGHCHHGDAGRVPVPLNLASRAADPAAQRVAVRASLVGRPLRSAAAPARAVVPGDAASSVLVQRMRQRGVAAQMPPLGTRHVDREGVALVERWIQHEPNTPTEENLR